MVVSDSNVIVQGSGLSTVEVVADKVRISVKNGATLTFSPKVEEGVVVGYEMDYLTGKENKKIERLELKIKEIESEIAGIKDVGLDGTTDNSDEDAEDEEPEEEE